jgi:hypothetical protein
VDQESGIQDQDLDYEWVVERTGGVVGLAGERIGERKMALKDGHIVLVSREEAAVVGRNVDRLVGL